MNQVFLKTRELGDAIMQSDEYKAMKAAEDQAMANADAADAMGPVCGGASEDRGAAGDR